MVDEEIVGAFARSCDEQHDNQEDDYVGTLFVISRHRWDWKLLVSSWKLHL